MKLNDKIIFKYDGVVVQYTVVQPIKKYFLSNDARNNAEIFNLLRIKNRVEFCEKEIGYSIARKSSDFPEVDSLEDLEKIVNALYGRIIEISTPKFKVGDFVIIAKKEGIGSDYPYSYTDEMASHESQLYTIAGVCEMQINHIGNEIQRLKYEEPFYYILKGSPSYWTSPMLIKIATAKDTITDITAKNIAASNVKILTDSGEMSLNGISSCIDTHSSAMTNEVSSNTHSCLEKSEESEYKLNFSVKPLNFLKDV